jgi:hypothetical protein
MLFCVPTLQFKVLKGPKSQAREEATRRERVRTWVMATEELREELTCIHVYDIAVFESANNECTTTFLDLGLETYMYAEAFSAYCTQHPCVHGALRSVMRKSTCVFVRVFEAFTLIYTH